LLQGWTATILSKCIGHCEDGSETSLDEILCLGEDVTGNAFGTSTTSEALHSGLGDTTLNVGAKRGFTMALSSSRCRYFIRESLLTGSFCHWW
jgi:hypothetical protein